MFLPLAMANKTAMMTSYNDTFLTELFFDYG